MDLQDHGRARRIPATPLRRVPPDELPPRMRAAWQTSTAQRGDATFIETAGVAPDMFDWYRDFYARVFYGGRVPVRIKELVRLRLSTVHGCAYCNRGNRLDARAAGLDENRIRAIDDHEHGPYSDDERAALAFADQVALGNPGGRLDESLHRRLREHFDDAEIFELGMTMAVLTGMAKFLFVCDLVEREPWCEFGGPPDPGDPGGGDR